jgi:hypothetical protein
VVRCAPLALALFIAVVAASADASPAEDQAKPIALGRAIA